MAASIRSMKQYLSLVETRVKDAETNLSTQMPQGLSKDQDVKANKVRVGLVRCRRLMVNKNEALEAVADKVEDDNDAIPVDETKSTAKPIPTRKRHFDPYDKDSEPNPESDEPEFKPGAKVLIHNPKTKHWDRSAIVINWRRGYGMSSRMEPKESREGPYGQARDVTTTTTNARRKVVFTHCGLKVHSYYSN